MNAAPAAWLEAVLVRELEAFRGELELFPNEELVWSVVPGVSNSAGTLALHVSGNLQHYLGAVLGATGYKRDRSLEFSRRRVARNELGVGLDQAKRVVHDVLSTLSPEALLLEYPEELAGSRIATGLFLVHLSTHLAHHLGQVGYLRRILTTDGRSSGAVSLKALADTART